MASVIHSLWEKGDRSPMILPSMIPIDDPRVQFELTRYLSDNWVPIIEKDVDGPNSLPLRIDGEQPNLGKVSATRRVARTIYLGSAPSAGVAHRGIEDRRVKLGCVTPGESSAVFGDALRRVAAAATYLYQDGTRFWYDTQATVTKLAEDRAEELKRQPDKIVKELDARLGADLGIEPKDEKRRGTSSASTPCHVAARMFPMSVTRGWLFFPPITRTRKKTVLLKQRPGRSSNRAATSRGSTTTRWSFSPWTRCGYRTSMTRYANSSHGSPSSTRRTL